MDYSDIVVGLDIGTTKIACLVGRKKLDMVKLRSSESENQNL